jgi:hypothetical protein
MWEDPIVAEMLQVRAAHAAQFNNDRLALYRDLGAHEQTKGVPARVFSTPSCCLSEKAPGQGHRPNRCFRLTAAPVRSWAAGEPWPVDVSNKAATRCEDLNDR